MALSVSQNASGEEKIQQLHLHIYAEINTDENFRDEHFGRFDPVKLLKYGPVLDHQGVPVCLFFHFSCPNEPPTVLPLLSLTIEADSNGAPLCEQSGVVYGLAWKNGRVTISTLDTTRSKNSALVGPLQHHLANIEKVWLHFF